MNRRVTTLAVAIMSLTALVVLAVSVPVPLVAMGPGPVFDTLAEVEVPAGTEEGGMPPGDNERTEIKPVVQINGATADSTEGSLDMTTVAVHQRLSFAEAAARWLDPDTTVVPRDQVFPPNRTQEQVDQVNAELMMTSENAAAQAAFHHLRLPLVATVQSLLNDGAAQGILHEGDRITALDGNAMPDSTAVVAYLSKKRPGENVEVRLERPASAKAENDTPGEKSHANKKQGDVQQPQSDAKTLTERIKLAPGDPNLGQEAGRGYLGAGLADMPANGTSVTINLSQSVGGPSAGLMFALAIVDKLSPGELTGGRHIAGTGEIDPEGKVGKIGGVRHKITAAAAAGATEFLVPEGNCGEAVTNPPAGIRLIKVETLDSAISALKTLDAGRSPELCTSS